MDVTKITLPGTMTAADLAFDSLVAQMSGDYVYFGAGTLSEAELASLNSAFAWDDALAASFNLLGELAESACKVDSKLSSLKTRKYRVSGKRTTTLELNLVGLSQLQKQYLESPAFSSRTLTLVLRSRAKDALVVFTGLKWTCSWSGEVDGLFTVVISSEFTGTTAGKIYAVSGIPTTGIFAISSLLPFGAWDEGDAPTQSYKLAAYQVSSPITLTAPTGYQISTALESGYDDELELPATFNGLIYVKLVAETTGAHAGNITAVADGVESTALAITGYRGDGSSAKPYPITTADQFDTIREDLSAYYSQLCDIDLSAFGESYRDGAGWIALGEHDSAFTGSYDGGNFAITGLYMNDPDAYTVALFGYCSGATLTNIRVIDPVIHAVRALGYYCGTLCTQAIDTAISMCHAVNVTIFGHGYLGGLAATLGISNGITSASLCSVSGRIVADGAEAAGFVYMAESDLTTIEQCFTNVRITPSSDNATPTGYAGFAHSLACNFKECYAVGSISADDYACGFASSIETAEEAYTTENCYAAVFIKCAGAHKAGFAGTIVSGSLVSCYFDSTVTGFTTEDPNGATPATSAEMFVHDTFIDWDFVYDWTLVKEASYPTLQNNPQ